MDLLWFISVVFVVACPFTKVEESFNVQAMHDLIYHKTNLTLYFHGSSHLIPCARAVSYLILPYDHHEFSGVVPRTFIGPIYLTFLVSPIYFILEIINLGDFNKFLSQCLVRIALASCVIFSFNVFKKSVEKEFGASVSKWLVIITGSQFHFLFYSSRPLPNIMVLPFVLLAYAFWLKQSHFALICLSAFSVIIFRFELALLLGSILLMEVLLYKISLLRALKIGLIASLVSLLCTIGVDSIFWNRLLWPEGEVFWFNSILNKSSEWGTSPFLWYFYSALPRALGTSLFLIPIGLIFDKRIRLIVIPPLAYIIAFSFLPHKELRFIIYTFPLLNLAAAYAAHRFWIGGNKSFFRWLLCVIVIGHVAINFIISVTLLSVAKENYPGGIAISKFHNLVPKEEYVHVYIDNMAAQTGVSRFTQLHDHWIYNKTENLNIEKDNNMFSHLLLEAKSKYSKNLKPFSSTHTVLEVVEGFSHVAFNYNSFPPIKFKTKPMIFILKQEDFIPPKMEEQISYNSNVEREETTPERQKTNKSEFNPGPKKRSTSQIKELNNDRKPKININKILTKKHNKYDVDEEKLDHFLSKEFIDFTQENVESDDEKPSKIHVNKVIAKKHPNLAVDEEESGNDSVLDDKNSEKLLKINNGMVKKSKNLNEGKNEPEIDKNFISSQEEQPGKSTKLKQVLNKKQKTISDDSEGFLSKNIDFNIKDELHGVEKNQFKLIEAQENIHQADKKELGPEYLGDAKKNVLKKETLKTQTDGKPSIPAEDEKKSDETISNQRIELENRSNKSEKTKNKVEKAVKTADNKEEIINDSPRQNGQDLIGKEVDNLSMVDESHDVPDENKKKTNETQEDKHEEEERFEAFRMRNSQEFLSGKKEERLEKETVDEGISETKKLPPITKLTDTTIIYASRGRGAIAKHVATMKKKTNQKQENEDNFLSDLDS